MARLLARLDAIYPQMQSTGGLNKHNLSMEVDPYQLAGYNQHENSEVRRHLLGAPWKLVNRGYLVDPRGEGWFSVSDEGQEDLRDAQHVSLSRSALAALELLSPELRRSQQFFREGRFKPSVAVAFQRIENRLNEVRDASSSRVVAGKSGGVNLPHAFFDSGDLKMPFPNLGAGDPKRKEAYVQSLKTLLSGAIGFVRNAFDHELHNLPDLDEKSAIGLLFFASYLSRIVEESSSVVAP